MSDEQVVARGMLSVLKKRLDAIKATRAPHGTSSEKQLYVLAFESAAGAGPQSRVATLGGDAAFVATKVLLVGAGFSFSPVAPAFFPLFELFDLASGGRQMFTSQQNNTPLQGLPITHFANTIGSTRAATYSAFALPSEYLLPRNGSVALRTSTGVDLRVALLGYKVYG